jgi:hypothetical protein
MLVKQENKTLCIFLVATWPILVHVIACALPSVHRVAPDPTMAIVHKLRQGTVARAADPLAHAAALVTGLEARLAEWTLVLWMRARGPFDRRERLAAYNGQWLAHASTWAWPCDSNAGHGRRQRKAAVWGFYLLARTTHALCLYLCRNAL